MPASSKLAPSQGTRGGESGTSEQRAKPYPIQ
nr:MAG TPA: hypothetical protein [Caudoviricetes sp.]